MPRRSRPLTALCLAVIIFAGVFPGAMVFMSAIVVPVWACALFVLAASSVVLRPHAADPLQAPFPYFATSGFRAPPILPSA